MGSGAMLAIGLMSGTSLDGIDAALIETDGEAQAAPIAFRGEPYSDAARAELAEATRMALTFDRPRASPPIVAAAELVTRTHVMAVHKLPAEAAQHHDRNEMADVERRRSRIIADIARHHLARRERIQPFRIGQLVDIAALVE